MRLSHNFNSREFECPCCHNAFLKDALVENLQILRDIIQKPINILSGYRCPNYNEQVGGVPSSQHIFGKAADIHVKMPLLELLDTILGIDAFKFGGVGLYPQESFIHVDIRGAKARWSKVGTSYTNIDRGISMLENTGR